MITVNTLKKMKAEGNKITMLACYEAALASVAEQAGVEVLLVGDSLGMVVQGQKSTLPVSLEDMCYHTAAVARGAQNAMILADLPFGSYQISKEQAFAASAELMAAGAHMVKLEGGAFMAETTHFLQQRGIPVCAHIGLTPQSVNAFGGYKVQGRGEAGQILLDDALAHDQAGASLILMECVPSEMGKKVTESVHAPTIGIGAGADCDGQVLVMHDMLGVFPPEKTAKFVKNFLAETGSIQGAAAAYVAAVKNGSFPAAEHTFA
ncbi:MAG: 3-methyl-2-oxobutanoate hydroxymethyltransferase [Neisseria sp.]|nr:3-methyl-2-oxobutanoate hydroxymethyltransferase [Neisseria sp.]